MPKDENDENDENDKSDSSDSEDGEVEVKKEEKKTVKKRKDEDKKEEIRVVKIKELDIIKQIHPTSVDDEFGGAKYLVIGKPGRGKTKLVKHIVGMKRDIIPIYQIYSSTNDMSNDFTGISPRLFQFDSLSVDYLKKFEERQKIALKHLRNPWACQVWDDTSDDTKIFNKPQPKRSFKYGRWWKKLLLICLQHSLDLQSNIRSAIDGSFIFRENSPSAKRRLWEHYIPIDDEQECYAYLDGITLGEKDENGKNEEGNCLFIDYGSVSDYIEDRLFWCRPDISIQENMKISCQQAWDFNDARIIDEFKTLPAR